MGIGNIDNYHQVITRFLNLYPDFEKALEGDDFSEDVAYFVREYLEDIYPTLNNIKEAIDDIPPKKQNNKKNSNSYQEILKFSYSHLIEFVLTNKVSGIPSSHNFLENLLGITINDQIPIHHSHITENINGYCKGTVIGK